MWLGQADEGVFMVVRGDHPVIYLLLFFKGEILFSFATNLPFSQLLWSTSRFLLLEERVGCGDSFMVGMPLLLVHSSVVSSLNSLAVLLG